MTLQTVLDVPFKLGEGPLWHPQEQKLYWVDIPEGKLLYYDPASQEHGVIYQGALIGGYTMQKDGSFLLFGDKGQIGLFKEGRYTVLVEEIEQLRSTRFNDVVADPVGRVFCGTMPDATGEAYLYRLDTDGSLDLVVDGIGLSNGMSFSPDKKLMYHVDSKQHFVSVFDYNAAEGLLSNRRAFLELEKTEIEPDGLTVDAEGHIWIAFWNGSCVRRYAPNGEQVEEILLPAKKVTSLAFGGSELDELYITSAGGDNRPEDGPQAGALFRVKAAVRGLPEHLSGVGL